MAFKYSFEEVENKKSKRSKKKYIETTDVKYEHVFQQIQNDLYEKIENGVCFNFYEYEKALLKNLLWKFNNSDVAKITGLCIRTIRNKRKKYGL